MRHLSVFSLITFQDKKTKPCLLKTLTIVEFERKNVSSTPHILRMEYLSASNQIDQEE